MNVLITGITGFAGSHLAEYIAAHHPAAKIHGLIRWRSRMENIAPLLRKGKATLHEADLKDVSSLRKALRASAPDRIYHLAAQSYVPASWRLPSETFAINAVGQINLFEAVLSEGYEPRIQIAGSSEEYGMVLPNEVPMKETNPLRPLSPYAVSKVAQDLLGYQYWQSYRLHIIRTRGFNHTGPRRGEVFVTSNFARQIAQIEKGQIEPVIRVGNLDAKRDFTDVRDTVRGYWLALEKGEPGEVYNIGTGTTIAMKDMLDILLKFSKVKVKIKVDPDRLRPSDVQILCADITKFKKATGWVPKIPLETTLRDLLDYWRANV